MSGEGILPARLAELARMAKAHFADAGDGDVIVPQPIAGPFALSTCDPRFRPDAPLMVDGFRFVPAQVEDDDIGGAVDG